MSEKAVAVGSSSYKSFLQDAVESFVKKSIIEDWYWSLNLCKEFHQII